MIQDSNTLSQMLKSESNPPKWIPILEVLHVVSKMFGTRVEGSKLVQIQSSLNNWKGLEKHISKLGLISIWRFEMKIMAKKMVVIQIDKSTSSH